MHKEDEIDALIKLENDPKSRAILLVLQNINLSLIANTQLTTDVDSQLKQHLVEFRARAEVEDATVNKGKGAWKVASFVLGLAQTVIIFLLTHIATELTNLHGFDTEITSRVLTLETYHRIEHGN